MDDTSTYGVGMRNVKLETDPNNPERLVVTGRELVELSVALGEGIPAKEFRPPNRIPPPPDNTVTALVNLTSHVVRVRQQDGVVISIPPSGRVARVSASHVEHETANKLSIYETTFGIVEGLSPPRPNTLYIVSTLVQVYSPNRDDLVSPAAPDNSPLPASDWLFILKKESRKP